MGALCCSRWHQAPTAELGCFAARSCLWGLIPAKEKRLLRHRLVGPRPSWAPIEAESAEQQQLSCTHLLLLGGRLQVERFLSLIGIVYRLLLKSPLYFPSICNECGCSQLPQCEGQGEVDLGFLWVRLRWTRWCAMPTL